MKKLLAMSLLAAALMSAPAQAAPGEVLSDAQMGRIVGGAVVVTPPATTPTPPTTPTTPTCPRGGETRSGCGDRNQSNQGRCDRDGRTGQNSGGCNRVAPAPPPPPPVRTCGSQNVVRVTTCVRR